MFHKGNYVNQVSMIESKSEKFKKKIHLPAVLFNKSPLRQSQNKSSLMNRSNTPSKRNGPSPLKSRRQDKSLLDSNVSGLAASGYISNSSSMRQTTNRGKTCQNHQGKTARYLIQSDQEQLPYCQKCAILLASQGFKVIKLQSNQTQTLSQLDNHPRKIQIKEFLQEQSVIVDQMICQKQKIIKVLADSNQSYQQQVALVGNYYGYIFQVLEDHKKKVLQGLRDYKNQKQNSAVSGLKLIQQCIADSNIMKQDILSSIQVIRQVQQRSFRPVMEAYKQKSYMFKHNAQQIRVEPIELKPIVFNNVQMVGKKLVESIQIQVQTDQEPEEQTTKQSSVYFSFDRQGQIQQVITSQQQEDEEQNLMQQTINMNKRNFDKRQYEINNYLTN